jgi:peptidoglycan hydrolase CwlO-like protein
MKMMFDLDDKKFRKIILLLLVSANLLLLVMTGLLFTSYRFGSPYEQATRKELEKKIGSAGSIYTIENSIDSANASIEEIKTQIKDLQDRTSNFDQSLLGITMDLSTMKDNINLIQSDISSIAFRLY